MRVHPIIGLMLTLPAVLAAQTATVQNAAIYQPPTLEEETIGAISAIEAFGSVSLEFPPNTISPHMLAVLTYGAPAEIIVGPGLPVNPPPVNATLFLRPVGSTSATPLTVTSAAVGAIAFVVPSSFPLGGAELLYQIDGQPTQWTSVNVVPSAFEFFRISLGGPAVAQVAAAQGSFTNVGLATPAQPGQTLLLTGSGLGNNPTVSATIGGIPATVVYTGDYPAKPGVDEILLRIPAGIADGCYVPVSLTYNQTTVTTTISETSGGSPCNHPWQLSVNDMKALDSGGNLESGIVNLSSQLNAVSAAVASRNESAGMNLSPINAAGIASYFLPTIAAAGPSCTATALTGANTVAFLNGDFSVLTPAPPDLGNTVTLQSPANSITLAKSLLFGSYISQNLSPPADGSLNNLPTSIPGGKWTWQSSGGKDLAVSSFAFTLPAPIQLNGGAPLSIRRDQDQTITWNGSAFDAGATVSIYVNGTTALVSCIAQANAGSVTIPASLLSGFAANTIGTITADLNESGSFLPNARLQLQSGSTLLVVVSFTGNDSRAVAFQ